MSQRFYEDLGTCNFMVLPNGIEQRKELTIGKTYLLSFTLVDNKVSETTISEGFVPIGNWQRRSTTLGT